MGTSNPSPRNTSRAPTRRAPTSTNNSSRYTSPRTPVRVRYNVKPRPASGSSLRDKYRVPTTRADKGVNHRSNKVRNNIDSRSSNRYSTDVRKTTGSKSGTRRPTVSNRYTPKRPVKTGSSSPRKNPGRNSGGRNPVVRTGGSGRVPRTNGRTPRISTRVNRTVTRPRRSVRKYASHRYRYGYGGSFGRNQYGRYHHHHSVLGHLLGLGWCDYLGYNSWNHYAYDPFYCNYYVGYGYHHYHWRHHYCNPLNYSNWWYPSTYCPPSYIYINSRGDYSAYPSTVVIVDDTPAEEPEAAPVKAGKASLETLIKRHVTLGDFYFKEGRYSEASESYLRALAYAPEDASIHFVLADALFALGDYHYAAFVIQKALRLDPAMAYAEADKRKFYTDKKEFEKHMATILSYLKEKPFDVAAHLVVGYNHKFSDQKAKAIVSFKRVLEIGPENNAAKLFLEALTEPPAKKDSKIPAEDSVKKAEKPAKKAVEKPVKKDH